MGIFLMSINIDFNNHVKCCIGFYPIGIPKCILLRLCCWSFRAVPIFQYHTPPPKGSAYLKRSPETELMKNTSQNHHPQRPAQRPPGKPSLLSGAPETAGRLKGRKLKILAYYVSHPLSGNWDSVLFSHEFLILPESPSPLLERDILNKVQASVFMEIEPALFNGSNCKYWSVNWRKNGGSCTKCCSCLYQAQWPSPTFTSKAVSTKAGG